MHTKKGRFRCRRVIVTAGAWINQVLSSVKTEIPVTVTQEQVTYIATPNIKDFTKEKWVKILQLMQKKTVKGCEKHLFYM